MKVFIRVDASIEIGTGHVYRCLNLAEALKAKGAVIVFICRQFTGNLIEFIRNRGFAVLILPANLKDIDAEKQSLDQMPLKHSHWLHASQIQDAHVTLKVFQPIQHNEDDWFLVDHYALDAVWEKEIQLKTNCNLAVLDGQADRQHHCDILIDPTMCQAFEKWSGLVSDSTNVYEGFPYIPVATDFYRVQSLALNRKKIRKILIAFGGVDKQNFTCLAMRTLLGMDLHDTKVDIVVGQNYPFFDSLLSEVNQVENIRLHHQTDRMHELMLWADLAIGAGGTMAWERCMVCLPSLVTVIADNQTEQVKCLENLGVAMSVSSNKHRFVLDLRQKLEHLLQEGKSDLEKMSEKARDIAFNAKADVWYELFNERHKVKAHNA